MSGGAAVDQAAAEQRHPQPGEGAAGQPEECQGAAAHQNLIQGNYIGTDVTGSRALRNGGGVRVSAGSRDNTLGGTVPGAGNLISGNGSGVNIVGGDNVLQGNLIGTDASGTQALGNDMGVVLNGPNNTVGGTALGSGNLISGNDAEGISISGSNALVQGNRIGTDATGLGALGNGVGVKIFGNGHNNLVGGTAARAGNVIAFNAGDGVQVDQGVDNTILRNAIFSNGHLGIELTNGGNHEQEAPVLTSATSAGGVTTVTGTLQSAPDTPFVVEVFVNQTCDPPGAGEGERFLASLTLTTDGSGAADFTLALALEVPPGEFVTATATDAGGSTSELSGCVEVDGAGARGVLFAAGAAVATAARLSAAPLLSRPGTPAILSVGPAPAGEFRTVSADRVFARSRRDWGAMPEFQSALAEFRDADGESAWVLLPTEALDLVARTGQIELSDSPTP